MRDRVNDFALKLANVNGTGSASANGLLMQAIFRMGIPVSGKNLFPSNIQGLPTWYEIRVNKNGYTARSLDYDLMVAMNSQTYARDIREVREGGYLLYDSSWPLDPALLRDDVHFLGVPFAQLCNDNFRDPRERILMKNIAYAGTLVAALQVDMEMVLRSCWKRSTRARRSSANRIPALCGWATTMPGIISIAAAVSSGKDGRERRQDSDRRQHRHRAGLRLRRRDGGRLVSDHAVDVRHGRFQGFLRKIPQRSGNRKE